LKQKKLSEPGIQSELKFEKGRRPQKYMVLIRFR